MRYTIEITSFEEVKYMHSEWLIGAGDKDNKDKDGPAAYGYAPPVEKTKEVERTILLQNKDEINVEAVIKAINNL